MSEFAVQSLLETPAVTVRDVRCQGSRRGQSAEEYATETLNEGTYAAMTADMLSAKEANNLFSQA